MTKSLVTALTMTIRVCGLAAFYLGLARWMEIGVPLQSHAVVGALVVLALVGLGLVTRRWAGWLSSLAVAWGLALPMTAALAMILPISLQMEDLQPVLRCGHLLCGLGGIALAEIVARRAHQGLAAAPSGVAGD